MRRRKDGSLVEASASVSPIRDPAGSVVGASRICRDITERRRTEEALRESEERLRLSAEAAQIGAWNNDLVARRVTWSPELERLVGLAPGSFRGTNEHVAQLLHPEDRDRALEAFNRAVERRVDFDLECRIIRADGELRWLFVRGGPRYDASGAAVSVAGVAMDVTGRKQLEDKLRQSQKLESLGVLAGGVAHDFNNLLVGVIGNAGLLLEETPPESPRRGLIENLMEAGERAAQLTRQMLAYSGKGQFVIERLNLEQQVRQILALIAASIPKGVKIELDSTPDLPSVEGDAGQLQQLIMNLVINGAEAIGEGGGTVTISTRLREIDRDYVRDNLAGDNIPPGSFVVLEVHDTGCGMDAATQARIFDPFFTTKFTGRGLGLAAVLGIVRGHKGALTVYSEPGTGTTFKVFLPVASESVPATIEPSVLTEFRGQGTILVVDDEEVVQRTLKTTLERYGYKVVPAGGGEEATEILRQMGDGIALILLDMTMPGLSGEQTLKRLREIRTDVPVIATSGYNEVEALRRFGAGLSGFIQKPFTPRKLAEKIQRVLSP
jgi:PAS domain S-box-containing protein